MQNVHISLVSGFAVVWMIVQPSKLNPVILPLMAAIKREHVNKLSLCVPLCIFPFLTKCLILSMVVGSAGWDMGYQRKVGSSYFTICCMLE
jgi:hypothetical protein